MVFQNFKCAETTLCISVEFVRNFFDLKGAIEWQKRCYPESLTLFDSAVRSTDHLTFPGWQQLVKTFCIITLSRVRPSFFSTTAFNPLKIRINPEILRLFYPLSSSNVQCFFKVCFFQALVCVQKSLDFLSWSVLIFFSVRSIRILFYRFMRKLQT